MAFSYEWRFGCLIVHCADLAAGKDVDELHSTLEGVIVEAPPSALVLDLMDQPSLHPSFSRMVAILSRHMAKLDRRVYAVGVSKDVRRRLSADGVSKSLEVVDSVAQVLRPFAPKPKIDVEFVNPFIDSALQTLKIQCALEAQAGKPTLKTNSREFVPDIAAVIGLSSKAFRGSVAVCFPQTVFLKAISNMLQQECTSITPEIEDGASELLNIMFSMARQTLNQKGFAVDRAIPTIVRGHDLSIRHMTVAATIVLPFETPYGKFQIEVAVEFEEDSSQRSQAA